MDQLGTKASDTALWSLVLSGEGEAFGQLFDRHRDRVFNHGRRLVGSSEDAEDVTAMVFLESWRCRKKVRIVNGSVLPWLLATTNYVVRNHLRSSLRYRRLLTRVPFESPTPDPAEFVSEKVDSQARSSRVQAAFRLLSRREQEVLALAVVEELSLPDVAAVLNAPLGTVKSRLSRAKRHLARLLEGGTVIPSLERNAEGRLP